MEVAVMLTRYELAGLMFALGFSLVLLLLMLSRMWPHLFGPLPEPPEG